MAAARADASATNSRQVHDTFVGQQCRGVLLGPGEEQVPDGHAGSAASSLPSRRACSVAPPYSKS